MNESSFRRSMAVLIVLLVLSSMVLAQPVRLASVRATANPASVIVVGNLQSELGCPGDWQPECAATYLSYEADDDVWQATFSIPAGSYEYKAALNGSWDENYGANAQPNGANIPLTLDDAADVKFFYDHETHWITDNQNAVIATVAGDFQSELGCPGDWQPDCLRSWMQDVDGDGVYAFSTDQIPAGSYEFKVALDEAWAVAFPASNVPFASADGDTVTFTFNSATNDVAVTVEPPGPPGPASVTIAGNLQSELGCPGDWQPECAATHLAYEADDDVWQGTFSLPAGSWEYKAALDASWDENYGANAQPGGANIPLSLADPADVKFYYDHKSHWVTDNVNAVIATAAGSFQSELGCPDDWQPWCLRSWLQDIDGDGVYTFQTSAIPPGGYAFKIALDEGWATSYPGADVPFSVANEGDLVRFT